MATLTLSQSGTAAKISYSYTAEANTWIGLEIYKGSTYVNGPELPAGSQSGSGTYDVSNWGYGTYTGKLIATLSGQSSPTYLPGGEATVTLNDPSVQCYFQYWYNGVEQTRYRWDKSLTAGSDYNFLDIGEFDPFDDTTLTIISSNVGGADQYRTYSSTTDFTCPSYPFTIRYYYVDLEIETTETTESTIKVAIESPSTSDIVNASTYTWRCGSASNSTGEFSGLSEDTSYTISLNIYDSLNGLIGTGSINARTNSGTKLWIYSGGWKKAQPWVYSGGWKKAKAWIYSSGWKPC